MNLIPEPLHPAVVHFPIALVLVALLFELLARHPRLRALETGGLALLVLGAVGAVVAVLTGEAARDAAVVPREARELVELHEEIGTIAMWSLLVVATLRVVLAVKGWYHGWRPWLFLLLAALAAGAVGYNGSLGGRLVFDHGIGTAPAPHSDAAAQPVPAGTASG